MTSFPIPEFLHSPSGDKYRIFVDCILDPYGGQVYLARNITYGEDASICRDGKGTREVAVKFEPKDVERPRLHDRTHAYNSLAGVSGIPFVHCSGTTQDLKYEWTVLDLLGPSLEALLGFCDGKFTLKTILLIADQALTRIEDIHSQSCIHGEIIPTNMVMGLSKFVNLLHLINPGSAEYPDAHLEAERSFRNDLNSLGYVLLHFAWPELSWEDLKSKTTEYLCQRLPEEFVTYFNHIRNLRSDEKPCYSYLRKIFDDLFRRMHFEKDYVFDWTVRKYQKEVAEKAKAIAQFEPSGEDSSDNTCDIALQLKSRRPSHEYLVAHVTDMYAALCMAENKCIEVDKEHGKPRQADSGGQLSDHQCLAIIDLHCLQLFVILDIIWASQHPAANPSLFKFASQRKLPTRMFRHGIQPLLDLLRDHLPESRSNVLSFLRLSYSVAALLYETNPELRTTWIECLHELARVFKHVVDTECSRVVWEKRIQHWKSLRDPAVKAILYVDVSDVMSPEAFTVLTTKPCHIQSGKISLQGKVVVPRHLSEKWSPRQFTKNLSDRSYLLVATCRDMLCVTAASFITSSYILRHEAQVITRWGSELEAQSFDPIYSNFVPDSFVLFLGSCLVFVCALASLHCRCRLDNKYQTHTLILVSIAGIIIGYGLGIGVKLTIFGLIPWALWLGMILAIVGHWVSRRCWWRTRCVRIELGEDTV